MQHVVDSLSHAPQRLTTIAIGDSPIDQSMLDLAEFPIGIPAPDGLAHVEVNVHNGYLATKSGARGWAESVAQVLDHLESGGTKSC